MKRFVCFLLAMILIMGMVPATAVTAFAASERTTSDKAIAILKEFEGFEKYQYENNGKWYIGYGSQIDKDRLASMMAYYVRTQSNPLFRYIPRGLKFACLRLGYRFFGESNSSVTVTNLGNFKLPEEMAPYIQSVEVIMTPRVQSPYGCSIISYGDTLTVNISTFRRKSELDEVFDRNLNRLLT